MQPKLRLLFAHFWQPILVGLLMVVTVLILLFGQLSTKPARLSAAEVSSYVSARQSLREIAHHPVNAPFNVPAHFMTKWFPHSIFALRSVSAIYGAIAVLLLFLILRYWQGWPTAVLGTLLFTSSSLVLHTARSGTPTILLFSILALFACALWLKHTLKRERAIVIAAIAIGSLLYVPGFIWFVAIGCVLRQASIRRELKHTHTNGKIIATIVLAAMVVPLVWSCLQQPSIVRELLGLPSQFTSPGQMLKNLYNIPLTIFLHAPLQPASWLGHLPILDIFGDVMLALGIYTLWNYRGLERSKLILGMSLVAIALITIGGPVTIPILVPLVYLTVATGLGYMLELWFKVFPSNSFARITGIVLIVIAVLFSCNYQIQRYFIAWPKDSATQAVYNQKII